MTEALERAQQQHQPLPGQRLVLLPGCADHAGHHRVRVALWWVCPRCGGPRGEPFETLSYDGSRRLAVHGWHNPCGHLDTYAAAREEAGVKACGPNAHG
jgi:hypothetical protein